MGRVARTGSRCRFGAAQVQAVSREKVVEGDDTFSVNQDTERRAELDEAVTSVTPKSTNGTNGVAGDDILTGVLVMGGGLLALWPIVLRGLRRAGSWVSSSLPVAAAWAWWPGS
jgi:hypothetical protein